MKMILAGLLTLSVSFVCVQESQALLVGFRGRTTTVVVAPRVAKVKVVKKVKRVRR